MFSGIGGFELGIERATNKCIDSQLAENREERQEQNSTVGDQKGWCSQSNNNRSKRLTCVGFSEIDKYAIQCYQSHFPEHRNFGDATTINPNELPDFDLLCGGFPCQSFSIAGKRRGFEDTRGTLFFDIARIVEVKRPKIVWLENVKGLLNHDEGKTFRVIIQTLSELGYDVQWMVLNSKFFGVPQNRERVFIIGNLRGTSRPEILPIGTLDEETMGTGCVAGDESIIKVNHPTHESYACFSPFGCGRTLKGGSSGNSQSMPILEIPNTPQGYRVYDTKGISCTLQGLAGGVGAKTRLYATPRIRRLTPIECERLQGFPDGWTSGLSDTQRYKCLGNAVTVNVIEAIARKLL